MTQLETRVAQLEQLLEKATRATKRQAAPFSKGPPKDDPKKPGRQGGSDYGPKAHRPVPEQKPDEVLDVPLPRQCPDCGGPVQEDHTDQQFQVEIPRKPLVRRFDVHLGRCRDCGRRIRPRHALQTSQATGAAASQLGPDLQAAIALMKDKYGLGYGDIQGLLDQAFGISISRGSDVVRKVLGADYADHMVLWQRGHRDVQVCSSVCNVACGRAWVLAIHGPPCIQGLPILSLRPGRRLKPALLA